MNLDLLIPTYNRACLLHKCIESVISANHPRDLSITVVVIDNGSSDDTKRVVESFSSRKNFHR